MQFKEIAQLDKVIHEPARLAIMSVLNSCSLIEFLNLQKMTGLTKGNLSSHLSKLEKAKYILIEKQFIRKKIPHTTLRITYIGEVALEKYWYQIDKIQEFIRGLSPQKI